MSQRALIEDQGWEILNAEELSRQYPGTFRLPSRTMRESLESGAVAKMIFRFEIGGELVDERMWVQVKQRIDSDYLGMLDSIPTSIEENTAFWLGSPVVFGPENVIDVFKD